MAKNKHKGTVSIQALLQREQGMLTALCQRASELQIFQEKLKAKLPPPIRDQFILANINGDVLTLLCESSAWAARIRFLTPDILQSVLELYGPNSPRTIRIKVVAPVIQNRSIKRSINLSRENIQLIQGTASSITDPILQASLTRLARGKS